MIQFCAYGTPPSEEDSISQRHGREHSPDLSLTMGGNRKQELSPARETFDTGIFVRIYEPRITPKTKQDLLNIRFNIIIKSDYLVHCHSE